jgi:hypothetical protein
MRQSLYATRACVALACVFMAASAHAADNYASSFLDFNQVQTRQGFTTLDKLLNGLEAKLGNSATQFDLQLRGVAGTLVDSDGPCCLSVDIPALGISNERLSGQTYRDDMDQLRKLLTQGNVARRLARESARVSPLDPIAGNPASQMARLVAFDFAGAFSPFASNVAEDGVKVAQAGGLPAGAVRGPLSNLPGVGAQLGLFKDGGQSAKVLTVPLSYSMRSDLDPRRQFNVYLPVTVADINGARVSQFTLGGSVRLPLAKDWALTTAINYSTLDGKDLGQAGKMASLALISAYTVRGDSSSVSIGNLLGHYRTLSGTVGGVDTGSGVANTVLRNGVLWSMAAPAWVGFGNSIEYSFVNTHYTGTALYLKNYSELGVSVGTNRRADSLRSYMQASLAAVLSSKTKGLQASFGYWF